MDGKGWDEQMNKWESELKYLREGQMTVNEKVKQYANEYEKQEQKVIDLIENVSNHPAFTPEEIELLY